jgi:hypothetical protein
MSLDQYKDHVARKLDSEKLESYQKGGRPSWDECEDKELVLVPREIDRQHHRHVLEIWNKCMANYESLEMVWPKLVEAMAESN